MKAPTSLLLFAASICAIASTAAAQNAGPGVIATSQTDESLETVIVTARRFEERLQDVPISITVFSQEQLSNRNIVNAADLATYTPSLSADNRFGPETSTFSIRGFTQELRTTPSVGTYFADVVAPRGGGNGIPGGDGAGPGAFFDLMNVQVLKGPQGTLFGRNTTGGAVLLVPQKPTADFGGYVEGSLGDYNMRRIQAVLNAPLSDKVRLRLGVDRQKRDGYENNITGIGPSKFGDVDYTAARASLVIDILPTLENYTIATYSRSDTAGTLAQPFVCDPKSAFAFLACPQVARQGGGTFVASSDFYDVQNTIPNAHQYILQWQAINTTTWHATNDFAIKNIFSYGEFRNYLRQEAFGTNLLIPSTFFGFPTGPLAGQHVYLLDINPVGFSNDQSTLTEELQFQGRSSDDRFTWQGGGYLEVSNPLSIAENNSPNLISCSNLNPFECVDTLALLFGLPPGALGNVGFNDSKISYRDHAVYAQGTYKITNQLRFTAGARYTDDKSEGSGYLQTLSFTNPANPAFYVPHCIITTATLANNCFVPSEQHSSAPTWTADLDYSPTQDVMTYAKYSRGYRQGSVVPQGAQGFQTYQPEKVDTYELGAKTSFHGAVRGTFNVAAFYNNFTQQQLQAGFISSQNLAPETTGIVNAGKSRMYGVEVEGSISPISWFRLDGGYTYLNTKLQQEAAIVPPPGSVYDIVTFSAQVGGPLPFSPEHKGTLTGTFTLPVPQNYGQILLATTYVHTSSYITSAPISTPYGVIPATNLVNLNLNWNSIAGSKVDASFFVTNLTDEQYYTFVPGVFNALGFEPRSLGEPRMFGARVRWRW